VRLLPPSQARHYQRSSSSPSSRRSSSSTSSLPAAAAAGRSAGWAWAAPAWTRPWRRPRTTAASSGWRTLATPAMSTAWCRRCTSAAPSASACCSTRSSARARARWTTCPPAWQTCSSRWGWGMRRQGCSCMHAHTIAPFGGGVCARWRMHARTHARTRARLACALNAAASTQALQLPLSCLLLRIRHLMSSGACSTRAFVLLPLGPAAPPILPTKAEGHCTHASKQPCIHA